MAGKSRGAASVKKKKRKQGKPPVQSDQNKSSAKPAAAKARAATPKTAGAKIRTWALRLIIPVILILVLGYFLSSQILQGMGDPGLPDLLDDAATARLIQTARDTLSGVASSNDAPNGAPIEGVIGAIVTIYDREGPKLNAGCFETEAGRAVACAAQQIRDKTQQFGQAPEHRVSIHLLRELRSAWPVSWREKGWGYSNGLYSLLIADQEKSFAITDLSMNLFGLRLEQALKMLAEGKGGVRLAGNAPKTGRFIVPTESYTEYNGRPVRLYRAASPVTAVTPEQIRENCRLGGDYLVRALNTKDNNLREAYPYLKLDWNQFLYNGHLGYDRYFKTYNLLRHAGTIYALYQLYRYTDATEPRRESYRVAADHAWKWVLNTVDTETDEQGRTSAFVVEYKGNRKKSIVKLGGTGLLLIALGERLSIIKERPDLYPAGQYEEDLELARRLANHVRRSQDRDGSFRSYWPYDGKDEKRRRSLYYHGEAMLGLLRLYRLDPQPEYLACVERAAEHYIDERFKLLGMRLYVPIDAWLMLTLNELDIAAPNKKYVDYCMTLTDMMINDQFDAEWEIPYRDYDGGYFPYPPSTTPSGSRMEGISACYLTARRNGRDTEPIRACLERAARFQIERIVRPEFAHLYPNPQRALGAFRQTPLADTTQIDTNQHNISGLLVTADILEGNFSRYER